MDIVAVARRYIKVMNVTALHACYPAGRLILAALVISTCIGSVARSDETSFSASLEQLADKCDELQLPAQAKLTRAWHLDRDPQRHYLFLPQPSDPLEPAKTAPQLERFWYAKFRALRDQQAEELFAQAQQHLERTETAAAYRVLHAVLRQNPDHAETRRILGYHGGPGKWMKRFQKPRARRGRATHRTFGWSRNAHWIVESEHFLITTNSSAAAGIDLANELEEVYTIWQQLFFGFWNVNSALKSRWNGGAMPFGAKRQFQVVLFRGRQDYIDQLSPLEPQIAQTVGYYFPNRKTSFFYAGDQARASTRWHEVTHQFFQESRNAATHIGANRDFWIVEGAALYMESIVKYQGYCTVGGFDASRLQYARYRKLSERFYLPMDDLTALGKEALQQHPAISNLYSQAAGVTHLLMDTDRFGGPDSVVRYLRSVYQIGSQRVSLAEAIGQPLATIDNGYDAFLKVTDAQMPFLRPPATLNNLCLAKCPVTPRGLAKLNGYEQLQWLDLGYTAASDATVAALGGQTLKQLNLEGTPITDAALKQIGQFPLLEELDLSNTSISDAGVAQLVAQLKSLPKLNVLWLTNTRITDASLKHLSNLKNLTFLNTTGTQVSAAGFAKLKDQLPQLNRD